MRPLIVLEFNELSPTLIDKFIGEGRLPNFARLRRESKAYVTDADERAPNLEPWIQWITVHTGLGFEQHGIFELGEGHQLAVDRLWDIVSAAGERVWVCGSMNAGYRDGLRGFVLPDPWASGTPAYPEGEFDDYYGYVVKNVQEHTRDKMPVTLADHVRFLRFMLGHGVSVKTVVKAAKQLMAERGGKFRWKRAAILDRFQWDLFRDGWKKHRPAYATFFLNSTAHYQHMHWRNMDPDAFEVKPAADEQAEFEDAVAFGYEQMDELVGECLELAGDQASVALCTAISQQPCLIYEATGGKTFYRPRDPERLFAWAGIERPWNYAPVMSEQFHLYFPNAERAADAAARLRSITLDGVPAIFVREDGQEVFAGCRIVRKVGAEERMICASNGAEAKFLDYLYSAPGTKSGMHHPHGIFWVRVPGERPEVGVEKVPLRQVAPTLLEVMGVAPPAGMQPSIRRAALETSKT